MAAMVPKPDLVCPLVRLEPHGPGPGPPAHDDHLRGVFTATAPTQVWVSDLTQQWIREGKLYTATIKDLYANKIVGYSMNNHMSASLAVVAIGNGGNSASTCSGSDRASG